MQALLRRLSSTTVEPRQDLPGPVQRLSSSRQLTRLIDSAVPCMLPPAQQPAGLPRPVTKWWPR
jgi:hypothetical protein